MAPYMAISLTSRMELCEAVDPAIPRLKCPPHLSLRMQTYNLERPGRLTHSSVCLPFVGPVESCGYKDHR
jgi:hypothetical protein